MGDSFAVAWSTKLLIQMPEDGRSCTDRRLGGCLCGRSVDDRSALDLDQRIGRHHTMTRGFNEQGVDVDA